jgi:hypothetical protein
MTLKLIVALLAGLGSLLYWAVAFIILYHLNRFGIGVQPKRFSAAFLLGSMILFAGLVFAFAYFYLSPEPTWQ